MRYLRGACIAAIFPLLVGLTTSPNLLAQNAGKQATAAVTPAQEKFFESSIRPMLAEKCYSCHSATEQRAGLRLDSREAMLKGNAHGPVLAPGDTERSVILQVVAYTGKIQMPPSGKLRPAELAALTSWVKMGAPWPVARTSVATPAGQAPDLIITAQQKSFWSFVPVKKPSLPKVKASAWAISPIDRFVLAKLEAAGLKPAPNADRRTLIRRVTVDLTGLLPTPTEVDLFVNDKSPDAWAKVVDRLLASPQYGERWGRHWLDLVRYADSNGLDENVAFANSYRYRDYVVSSFNVDKPYNEFVTEQLAGDLMASRDDAQRNERLIATGFLELGPKVLAEPDKEKMVMDIVDEQIDVSTKAFLGLTVACARCHNHKFDPIPTKDYYALAGIFKSTRTMSTLNTVAMWEEKPLASAEFKAQQETYNQKLNAAKLEVQNARRQGDAQLLAEINLHGDKYLLAGWIARQSMLVSVAESPEKFPYRNQIEAENYNRGTGIEKKFDGFGQGIGVIHTIGSPSSAEWDIVVPSAGRYQVELRYASAEERPVKLLLNGKAIRETTAGANTGSFEPAGQKWEPQGVFDFVAGKNTLRIERTDSIPHFDKLLVVSAPIAQNGGTTQSPEQLAAMYGLKAGLITAVAELVGGIKVNPQQLSAEARTAEAMRIASTLKPAKDADKYYPDVTRQLLKKAEADQKAIEEAAPQTPMAMAAEDGKVEDCRVHIRGDTQTLGDSVPRHFLAVLNGSSTTSASQKQSGRLELAEWLTKPNNPLTARVAVNRIWQEHFGVGLSKTPDNFGLLGDRPVNQPLLDWLASSFVEGGWSMKKLHREILLSNTYKMACSTDALTTKKADNLDPENRLLWRMPRRRMDADAFRDSVLLVAGNLDTHIGGSLLPTKNHDYVTNDQSANAAVYDSPRRSLYLPIIRNALFDMFQAFDMGDPSMVNASRSTTTVTPQALFVMNSPFMLAQSRAFAHRLALDSKLSDAERIRDAFARAYSRTPSVSEANRASRYLSHYAGLLERTVSDAGQRREMAWASWCQLLFASNAFIYLD